MRVPAFIDLFGRPPAVRAEAPGRANLIGEHTDYNGGFVLPTAIPQRTRVELAPSAGRKVRVWSAADPKGEIRTYDGGAERAGRGWLDYVQGVSWALAGAGQPVGGFDLRIASAIPSGAGLASSAALGVALARALAAAFTLDLDVLALARLCLRSENEFVGARVGVMDPLACALGEEGSALFLDTRNLRWERLPMPPTCELAVIDSGLAHGHAAGGYNVRRAECEDACRLLGVRELRDAGPEDLPRLAALPEPLGRRARHVVTENARVLAASAALRAGDAARLGGLMDASHASLRDDYEVSLPDVDTLVALARAEPGVLGARLTGGGFGGAVIVLARAGTARALVARVARAYRARTGRRARRLVPERT